MNYSSALRFPYFKEVGLAADSLGIDTYVVGGYVRDKLLHRSYSGESDFVCVGDGVKLAQVVASRLGGVKVSIFQHYGTARIDWKGHGLEFVGARKESYDRNSRNPLGVERGTLHDDQHRRDFTINAMTIGLNKHNWGVLIDPFNGIEDIRKKIIRTPLDPKVTFSDDPLRMVRAVRFATCLNFDIAPDTFEAIIAQSARLGIVSMERITEELNKIIMSDKPSYGFKLLFHSKLLHLFFPEMVALQGKDYVDNKTHKDNFYHTLQVLDNVAKVSNDLWLRWAAILHDIAKPQTKQFDPIHGWTFHGHEDKGARMVPRLFRKLKLPMREPMRFVQKLVRLHLRPIALAHQVTDSAVRRLVFEAGESTEALMKLCRADITSKNQGKVEKYMRNFDRVEQKIKQVEEKDRLRRFQPPIMGDEIIKLFNIPPGPVVGQIKERIKDAILDGEIENDRKQAYDLMMAYAHKKGLKKNENEPTTSLTEDT